MGAGGELEGQGVGWEAMGGGAGAGSGGTHGSALRLELSPSS